MPKAKDDLGTHMTTGYDIVGDIHGHYDHLKRCCASLGMRSATGRGGSCPADGLRGGSDRPRSKAGRGPEHGPKDGGCGFGAVHPRESRVQCGLLGDAGPRQAGAYLRPHGKPGNRKQHHEFLRQVEEGSALHHETVAWFRTLPLWLDLGEIRVVHACWHAPSIRTVPRLRADRSVPDELYIEASRKGERAFESIETLCKGIEVALPAGISFHDKDGKGAMRRAFGGGRPTCPTTGRQQLGRPM